MEGRTGEPHEEGAGQRGERERRGGGEDGFNWHPEIQHRRDGGRKETVSEEDRRERKESG